MKKIAVLLVIALLASTAPAHAFFWSLGYAAKSGDKELDVTLSNINREASSDKSAFALELSSLYRVPKVDIDSLLFEFKLSPADAYMTIRLSLLSGKPISVVVGEYKKNKGQGWGVIAKNLGIKPGSAAFHELKSGATKSLTVVKESKANKNKYKNQNENQNQSKNKNKNK
jgi:hypothetical protein